MRRGNKVMCCLCGEPIHNVMWAIRDYKNETYLQWLKRHILTVLKLRIHKEDGSLPICRHCYLKAKAGATDD